MSEPENETKEECNARIDSAREQLATLNSGTAAFVGAYVSWVTGKVVGGAAEGTEKVVPFLGIPTTAGVKDILEKQSDAYEDKMREQCEDLDSEDADEEPTDGFTDHDPVDQPDGTSPPALDPNAPLGSAENPINLDVTIPPEASYGPFVDPFAPLGSPDNPIDLDAAPPDDAAFAPPLDPSAPLGSPENPINLDSPGQTGPSGNDSSSDTSRQGSDPLPSSSSGPDFDM